MLSNGIKDMLLSVLSGHETEFDGLLPFQQDLARKAQSTVAEALAEFANAEETIARSWLIRAYFDAISKRDPNGWTERWSARPKLTYVFPYEPGSMNPVLLTIPSPTTTNTLCVMVGFRRLTWEGLPEVATADFFQIGLYDSAVEAEDRMRDLASALKHLIFRVPELMAQDGQRSERGDGLRWDDTPDF